MALEIYPIKLGDFKDIYLSLLVFIEDGGPRTAEKVKECPSLSYLILGAEKPIIVDTGVRGEKKEGYEVAGDPVKAYKDKFRDLGISFDDVGIVILTHLHFDHMENIHLFPNAKIYVQRKELEAAAAGAYRFCYIPKNIGNLIANYWDRLVLLDGDTEIVPGVRTVLTGGHTPGSQAVYVETSKGTAIIPGDVVNIYENLTTGRSPKDADVYASIRAIEKIRRDGKIILPTHDPLTLERYPVVK